MHLELKESAENGFNTTTTLYVVNIISTNTEHWIEVIARVPSTLHSILERHSLSTEQYLNTRIKSNTL